MVRLQNVDLRDSSARPVVSVILWGTGKTERFFVETTFFLAVFDPKTGTLVQREYQEWFHPTQKLNVSGTDHRIGLRWAVTTESPELAAERAEHPPKDWQSYRMSPPM